MKVVFNAKERSGSHVMSSKLVTLDVSDPVSKARRLFESSSIHHLPVVSGDELVGIMTWSDFLRISFGELEIRTPEVSTLCWTTPTSSLMS